MENRVFFREIWLVWLVSIENWSLIWLVFGSFSSSQSSSRFVSPFWSLKKARLVSSRHFEAWKKLVSFRLANLRCHISSRFTSQKRDQILWKNWLAWLVFCQSFRGKKKRLESYLKSINSCCKSSNFLSMKSISWNWFVCEMVSHIDTWHSIQ